MALNVNFTTTELEELISNKDSAVTVVQNCTERIILLPFQLHNPQQCIKDFLHSKVAKYDRKLDGIILSHKYIRVEEVFALLDDGRSKIKCVANIYVFKPRVDCILTGIINKKSKDHLGCLVHRVFNIVIPRPNYVDPNEWIGTDLKVGQEVRFKVVEVDLNEDEMPYIKGELLDVPERTLFDEEDSPRVKKCKKKSKCKEDSIINEEDKYEETEIQDPLRSPKRKKKRKRSKSCGDDEFMNGHPNEERYDSVEGSYSKNTVPKENSLNMTGNREYSDSPRKKKRKSECFDQTPNIETEVVDSTVSPRKKKKKSELYEQSEIQESCVKAAEKSRRVSFLQQDNCQGVENEESPKKEKRKKRKRNLSESNDVEEEGSTSESRSKKKRRRESSEREDEGGKKLEMNFQKVNGTDLSDVYHKSPKKRKSNNETDFSISVNEEQSECTKKKKKRHSESYNNDNSSFMDSPINPDLTFSSDKKKKRVSQECQIENSGLCLNVSELSVGSDSETANNSSRKKKKKKRKQDDSC